MARTNRKSTFAKLSKRGLPNPDELTTARGGRALHLQTAEIFTEERQSRPGPWVKVASSRVLKARYDFGLGDIQMIFLDGTPWVYQDVDYTTYTSFLRSESQGRFINEVLNHHTYHRGSFTEWDDGTEG